MIGDAVFAVIILIFIAKDFSRDAGLFRRSKIIHAVIVTVLIVYYSGNFKFLAWLIRAPEQYQSKLNSLPGFLTASQHFYAFVLEVIVSCALFTCVTFMTKRSMRARRWFIWLLPPMVVLESIAFVRGYLSAGPSDDSIILIFVVPLIIFSFVAFGIIAFYRSKSTIDFFTYVPVDEPQNGQDQTSDSNISV